MGYGIEKPQEVVLDFAAELEKLGERELARELRGIVDRVVPGSQYRMEREHLHARQWMQSRKILGLPVFDHWNRFLARRRQAERRAHLGAAQATISLDASVKTRLARLKQPGETWSGLLMRLANAATPSTSSGKR